MSGHSKWHSIKHKKAATDAKRGKMFTKVIKEITIAARLGGGDLNSNPRLRTAVQAGKDINMPKDNIDKAIKKGTGELAGVSFEDFHYEGYGPGGVAMYVEGTTDNKNRTGAEIKHTFSRYNGNLGEPGCVAWMFTKKGQIVVNGAGISEDDLIEIALEAGADDVQGDGESFNISTEFGKVEAVRAAIEAKNIKVESSAVAMVPNTTVKVEGKDAESLVKLINALEDHDDITNVSANFEMDDALLEQFDK